MILSLAKYSEIGAQEYLDYITEWELNNEHIVPYAVGRYGRPFDQVMVKWHEDETDIAYEKGFVPSTLFFLINSDRKVLGAIHFRHELNDKLLQNGGHIGYGIRKSERQKGYAHKMLSMLLESLTDSNIEKVLLTCDDTNIGSIKTIESCHGILQDKVMFEGKLSRRYWIKIKDK